LLRSESADRCPEIGVLRVSEKTYKVLFLCTGNSARSIMAEVLLNHLGRGRFNAFSAGSHPTGQVHSLALDTLATSGLSTSGLRSKSWDEFARPDAPPIDFILTVCDSAAKEVCPVWPGNAATAHWAIDDPAAVRGSEEERRAAFRNAAHVLRRRIETLVSLSDAALAAMSVRATLDEIGRH
jgi:arsenate reductase (thioredoxin)